MTSERVIKHEYFRWLQSQVGKGSRYTHLLTLMHEKEFVWFVPNDDNRSQDGRDLRLEFIHEELDDESGTAAFRCQPVSVLEVMIGLTRRLEFETDCDALNWAAILIENLGLHECKGRLSPGQVDYVNDQLDDLVWRRYHPDGTGGFFPLAWPDKDQTKVELWYQMSSYINERCMP